MIHSKYTPIFSLSCIAERLSGSLISIHPISSPCWEPSPWPFLSQLLIIHSQTSLVLISVKQWWTFSSDGMAYPPSPTTASQPMSTCSEKLSWQWETLVKGLKGIIPFQGNPLVHWWRAIERGKCINCSAACNFVALQVLWTNIVIQKAMKMPQQRFVPCPKARCTNLFRLLNTECPFKNSCDSSYLNFDEFNTNRVLNGLIKWQKLLRFIYT